MGSNSSRTVSLETDCAERSLQVQRDTCSAARGKESEKKGCSPGGTDQRQTSIVPSATGTVIPASDWPATPDAVPERTPRPQLLSLPRLKDAWMYVCMYGGPGEQRLPRKRQTLDLSPLSTRDLFQVGSHQ